MSKIAFILNGSKKRDKRLTQFLIDCDKSEQFEQVSLLETYYPLHATDLAKEAVNNYDYVIAVGGDGTLNEVINGIIESDNPNIVCGLIPYGTANDFARAFNLRLNWKQFQTMILTKNQKLIDIGLVETTGNTTKNLKYFINVADIGLGGFVADKITNSKSIIFKGKAKFIKAIFHGFAKYPKPEVEITQDLNYTGNLLTLAICNSNFFGHGLCISPEAKIDDGIFHTTLIGKVRILDYLRNIKNLRKGKQIVHPKISYSSANSIVIKGISEECPIEVDGEYLGTTPATVSLLPKKLLFLLP